MLGKVPNTALRIFSAKGVPTPFGGNLKKITRRLKRAKNSVLVLKSTCILEGGNWWNWGVPPSPLSGKLLADLGPHPFTEKIRQIVFETLPCIRERHHIELKQSPSIFVHLSYISKAASSCKRLQCGTYSLDRLEKSLEGNMGGKLLE